MPRNNLANRINNRSCSTLLFLNTQAYNIIASCISGFTPFWGKPARNQYFRLKTHGDRAWGDTIKKQGYHSHTQTGTTELRKDFWSSVQAGPWPRTFCFSRGRDESPLNTKKHPPNPPSYHSLLKKATLRPHFSHFNLQSLKAQHLHYCSFLFMVPFSFSAFISPEWGRHHVLALSPHSESRPD